LLLHVVDSSAVDPLGQIAAVREVLGEIAADRVPELLVCNKADANHDAAKRLVYDNPGSVAISAATGEGIDDLLRTIADRVRSLTAVVELLVPYERGDVMASLHREGEVVSTSHEDGGIRVRARLADASRGRLTEFVVVPQ
jgi:GTP-binding protein HflX